MKKTENIKKQEEKVNWFLIVIMLIFSFLVLFIGLLVIGEGLKLLGII